jgi:hypothetical protein
LYLLVTLQEDKSSASIIRKKILGILFWGFYRLTCIFEFFVQPC